MSKVAKIVAKVASVVAIVAAVAAAVTGNAALAAVLLKVSAVAGAVGAVAGTVAQMTAKKPPARGSPNMVTIGANQPMPIVVGETYIGGNKVHETGYGGKVNKVQNPYKFETIIHSGCGPVQAINGLYADFAQIGLSGTAATGYFGGFLYADQQLGERPESNHLVPQWAGAPDWSSAHKLSGYAATGLSSKFDPAGKIFASGTPQWGVTLQGVKAYDARLDSTYPGGSGPQRIDDRSTWAYSDNPGVVGATYCHGWFHDGKKQGGIGMPIEGIDLPRWVEFANICDANGWKVGGAVYEPGSRWDNLKDICAAGGGEPYFDRHLLGVNYSAPRVSLDIITRDDIADEGFTVASGQTWRDRLNTIAPKFRSPAHKWEYVPASDVTVAEYVADDGEEKRSELTWNLVQNKDQVAQLAAYELVNRREIGQISVSCKPRLMRYSVGDMLTFDLPGSVLHGVQAIIIRPPEIDPETCMVKLTMLGETDAKHAFALGRTSTVPPVPALIGTDTLDEASSVNNPSGGEGTPGAPGEDGKTTFVHFAYSDSINGTVNFTIGAPGTRTYVGVLTDFVIEDSTDPTLYTWSKFVGTSGENGTPGAPGEDGQSTFVHIAYSTSPTGSTGFSTTDGGGKTYIGTYTDGILADSTNPAVYTWSLIKGENGDDGQDGISPVAAAAIPANKQFTADNGGAVKTGQLPFNVAITATKAGAAISGSVSIIGTPSGCAATPITGGFTITEVFADAGFVEWRFTASDGQIVENKMSFSRQRDPASGGSVSVSFANDTWFGSGSYAASGPSTVLAASSTGKLRISGYASYYTSGTNGSATITAKLQYRLVGSGSWIDSGFTATGLSNKLTGVPGEPDENTPGDVNPAGLLTGLTANGSYQIQMVGTRSGAPANQSSGYVAMSQEQ